MVEQNYEERLERLYSNLNHKLEIYREGKRRWAPFLSTDFNVVSEFIIINKKYFRREDRLSDIIKCLLDANGSHGQGSKFLDAFLKRLYEKNHKEKNYIDIASEQRPCFLKRLFDKKQPDRVAELSDKQRRVEREDPTNQRRRIDITVGFEGFEIGIENKPWTHESNDQLQHYYCHLKEKNEEFCLVFITPNGTHPKTIGKSKEVIELIEKGELYCFSYNSDILKWIEECWQLCESDRFRWFLRDFRDYIRSEPTLRGEQLSKLSGESKIIIKHALENKEKENVAIVLDITHTDMVKRIETLLKDHEDFADVNIGQWYSLAPGLRKSIIETVVENSSNRKFEQNDNANKGKIIIEHALENEKNLEMTLDIILAGYELRQRIAMKFLKELEGFVRKEMKESRQWDDFKLGNNPFKSHRPIIFSVSKKKWGEQYRVGIQSGYSGRGVEIGAVFSDNHSSLRDELDEKLEIKREPHGPRDDLPNGWIKRLYSSDPDSWNDKKDPNNWNYENWCNTDTLVKMSTETGCVVKNVGEHLIKILKGAEPVIDKWIEENPLDS